MIKAVCTDIVRIRLTGAARLKQKVDIWYPFSSFALPWLHVPASWQHEVTHVHDFDIRSHISPVLDLMRERYLAHQLPHTWQWNPG